MNKGFYSLIVGATLILVVVLFGFQALSVQENKINSINKALAYQTRNALEDMHYAFDKSVTKVIKSTFNQSDGTLSIAQSNIDDEFTRIKNNINSTLNVTCSYQISSFDGTPSPIIVTVNLQCSKSIEGFSIELKKESIEIKKNYSISGSSPPYTISVSDAVGGYPE
jgi:hypothetical protein